MAEAGEDVVTRFYDAFARRDGATMASCYTADARFSDPVFTDLRGAEPGAMWKMLTERGHDLEVRLLSHTAGGQSGTANWVADYTFSQTGRRVHNDVRATFRFADGLIAEHRDDFSFYAWARQALGPVGLVLGWTPLIRGKVQRQAAAGLHDFMDDGGGATPAV
jgi:ketosteroid isomerase-like protein